MNYVGHPFESPSVLSFCPGILGLERGIERAIGKIRIAAYVEIEAFIIANLVAGMEAGVLDPAPVWTDAKTFDARPFHNKIHGIIGGYPCQPFSNAGKRLGEADPRHLWPSLRNHIEAIKPVWCFFENVEAHLKLGYRTVRSELEQLGYTVKEGIFSAEEVGAPHRRKRLFILAVMANTNSMATIRNNRDLSIESTSDERTTQRENRKWNRNVFEYISENVAYSTGSGFQTKRYNGKQIEKSNKRTVIPSSTVWPAGQGIHQQAWESPRIISREIESGMGIRVDGYNFREDLLRAFGNSVVEQTAELAFKTLLQKHFNTD